ncbi:secondary thiamine-phosphate synthase enzyme YjbQ [Candidatus Woesearchaeota archaeon]|nr:secondary thiamine-phosphate synthase enzyme YjbQ [Candidatus Woesearchaeota archaeon]
MISDKISLNTSKRNELLDITAKIQEIIQKSNVKEGLCLVFVPHATAAVMLFENADPALCDDFINYFKKAVPEGIWKHDKIDGNGDAHIKSGIVGCSESIPIKDNKLKLGTWQGITFCEFDGPRKRTIQVKVIK